MKLPLFIWTGIVSTPVWIYNPTVVTSWLLLEWLLNSDASNTASTWVTYKWTPTNITWPWTGASFNWVSSYIRSTLLTPALSTISFWLKTTTTTRSWVVRWESWLQASSVPWLFIEINSTTVWKIDFTYHDWTNASTITSTTTINDWVLHFFSCVKEASNSYKLYIDWVLDWSSTVNVWLVSKPIALWVWPDTPRFFLNWVISRFRVHNRALTLAERNTLILE